MVAVKRPERSQRWALRVDRGLGWHAVGPLVQVVPASRSDIGEQGQVGREGHTALHSQRSRAASSPTYTHPSLGHHEAYARPIAFRDRDVYNLRQGGQARRDSLFTSDWMAFRQ
jgi:hypothetical protein